MGLLARRKAERCVASTAALGMIFPAKGMSQDGVVEEEEATTKLLRKQWVIATTNPSIQQALKPFEKVPTAREG